ncbi:MAG: hypothetical protein OXC07_06985 [Kistimonas sp.]|nr:hypothetical protein [Kistimonas sp.]
MTGSQDRELHDKVLRTRLSEDGRARTARTEGASGQRVHQDKECIRTKSASGQRVHQDKECIVPHRLVITHLAYSSCFQLQRHRENLGFVRQELRPAGLSRNPDGRPVSARDLLPASKRGMEDGVPGATS